MRVSTAWLSQTSFRSASVQGQESANEQLRKYRFANGSVSPGCSADFQSAVSPTSSRLTAGEPCDTGVSRRRRIGNPAIRQVGNLRYERLRRARLIHYPFCVLPLFYCQESADMLFSFPVPEYSM